MDIWEKLAQVKAEIEQEKKERNTEIHEEKIEKARTRLREISQEAKRAKSDAVLRGLAAEREEILREVGKKCTGCGEYFLPHELRYGLCKSCYTEGRYDC